MQRARTIYFPDYPVSGGRRSGLTVPFAVTHDRLYERLTNMSSFRIRELLGFSTFRELEIAATSVEAPLATFVRDSLEQKLPLQTRTRKSPEWPSGDFQGRKRKPPS